MHHDKRWPVEKRVCVLFVNEVCHFWLCKTNSLGNYSQGAASRAVNYACTSRISTTTAAIKT